MADTQTTMQEIKTQVQEFCQQRDWDQFHTAKDLAIGLSTEAAELLEIFRFQTPEQIRQMLESVEQRKKMADELADCLFFLLRFAGRFGFDLSDAFTQKMVKNARKYSVEVSYGSNLKRTDDSL